MTSLEGQLAGCLIDIAGNIGMHDCFDLFHDEELSDFANLIDDETRQIYKLQQSDSTILE